MQNINCHEQVLPTSDTNFAATLLTFEIPLSRDMPRFAAMEFQRADLDKGINDQGKLKVFFNFAVSLTQYRAVIEPLYAAFNGKGSDADFESYVASLGLPDEALRKLKEKHYNAVAQACRETLENRKKLVHIIMECRKNPDWEVVHFPDGVRWVIYPANASDKTKRQLLEAVE